MPGIQAVRDRVVFPPAIYILVFIFVMMTYADGGNDFDIDTQVGLHSVAMDSGCLGGQGNAQGRGEYRAPDPERLHAGESTNVHAHNLPSTQIAADGTALCLNLKNFGVRRQNDVAQTE